MQLVDRTALVTGAGRGIGRAIAERFAAAGAIVGAADVNSGGAAETADAIRGAGGRALPLAFDVTDRRAIDAAVATLSAETGQVDVLVNNAAVTVGQDELGDDESGWDAMIATTLRGAYSCTRAVLPGMCNRGCGVIVNIASVNALTAVGDDMYSAAKAGLISMTGNVAVGYGPRGIRANAICPGTIRTPAWDKATSTDQGLFGRLAKLYPLRRLGEPGDVAAAALFLASDEASFISGAVLTVDGGFTAGNPAFTEVKAGQARRGDVSE